jgi:hypothetical protein
MSTSNESVQVTSQILLVGVLVVSHQTEVYEVRAVKDRSLTALNTSQFTDASAVHPLCVL